MAVFFARWQGRADRVVRPYKETDSHASLYPKGTCFAARTGSE